MDNEPSRLADTTTTTTTIDIDSNLENINPSGGESRQQPKQKPASLKPKPITHRSQSSPSSLTTHKFGLRPTPSPPRLIIDHQTGDIVESYPEQPVYLRTYQPLDDTTSGAVDDDDDYSTSNALDFDSSLQQTQSFTAPPPLPSAQKGLPLQVDPNQQLYLSSGGDLNDPAMGRADASKQDGGRPSRGGFIPPPHAVANKVYFAPPMPSAGHLFHHDDYVHNYSDDDDSFRERDRDRLQMNHHYRQPQPQQQPASETIVESQQSALQSTFKRAINKLNESSPKATTDIALVTHPDAESSKQSEIKILTTPKTNQSQLQQHRNNRPTPNQSAAAPATTAQGGATKTRYLSTTHEDNLRANERVVDHDPRVESFGLYSFCYSFRILLAIFLSSLIVYLLVVPLEADCTKYRPTYTYVSIIIASVNLICVTIFTLFWYCSEVTRTLYSNISSSAFIISIYSILVAINLAIAIIFFLIGTCHFQRLISTPQLRAAPPPSTAAAEASALLFEELLEATTMAADGAQNRRFLSKRDQNHHISHNHNHRLSNSRFLPKSLVVAEQAAANADDTNVLDEGGYPMPGASKPDANTNADHSVDADANGQAAEPGANYRVSPWEAGWEYALETLDLWSRAFHRFLIQYDLKFIGALHALCAIVFQYLAIKVAVVRSYFCYSPVEGCGYV